MQVKNEAFLLRFRTNVLTCITQNIILHNHQINLLHCLISLLTLRVINCYFYHRSKILQQSCFQLTLLKRITLVGTTGFVPGRKHHPGDQCDATCQNDVESLYCQKPLSVLFMFILDEPNGIRKPSIGWAFEVSRA